MTSWKVFRQELEKSWNVDKKVEEKVAMLTKKLSDWQEKLEKSCESKKISEKFRDVDEKSCAKKKNFEKKVARQKIFWKVLKNFEKFWQKK